MKCTITAVAIAVTMVGVSTAQTYSVYVAAESEDTVELIQFDGDSAFVAEIIPVGVWPSEIEGPHGLAISPDGAYWFVSMAHGQPFGTVYKYTTHANELAGQVELDLFPATMDISKATGMLYVANFNLHGDMVPSTISVVEPETMTEIARTRTGIMPHGSLTSADGMHHYSVAMMSNLLYEMDTATFEITRRLQLNKTLEEHGHENHGGCSPTWAQPNPDGKHVYVTCNKADRVLEVSTKDWSVTRIFETGSGPYNIGLTPDGDRMVVTYKAANATGVWDLESGKEVTAIPSTRRVPHGVAVSSDGRFAFVSVEGIGAEPGSVDIIDIETGTLVDQVDTGKQAGGIIFWRMSE